MRFSVFLVADIGLQPMAQAKGKKWLIGNYITILSGVQRTDNHSSLLRLSRTFIVFW
jgi:hypothetical protein